MASTTSPLAVVFDMDGLIIDSEPFWQAAEIAVFGALGVTLPTDLTALTQGMTTRAVTEFWFSRSQWQGVTLKEAENQVLARVAAQVTSEGALKPGVLSLLQSLKCDGLRIGLASNSPRVIIDRVIARFALQEAFDVVLSVEDVEQGKPAPDIYLLAAHRLGVAPSHCVALEDSVTGGTAALNAGFTVYAVPDGNADNPAFEAFHGVFSSLEGLHLRDLPLKSAR